MALKLPNNLSSITDLLQPAARNELAVAGDGVVGINVFTDFTEDSIKLGVTHLLFRRHEIVDVDRDSWVRLFHARVRRAILADEPPAGPALRVNRRRMMARAAEARGRKPRRSGG